MIKDLIKVKDKVAYILENYPATRDNDKILWLAYLAIFHDLKTILGEEKYKAFKSLLTNKKTPTMESVRRVRQKYQENGQWTGKKRIEKLNESENVRQWSRNWT